jgi:hypothetical protein
LLAKAIDAKLHDITGLQPDWRLETHANAGRRTGVDQVAWFEHQELAEIVNDESKGRRS